MNADQNPSGKLKEQMPSSTAMPADQRSADRTTATFRHLDRPDLEETFADSITGLCFDGQTLRIEFAVSRIDEAKPNMPISGRRYPTMTPSWLA